MSAKRRDYKIISHVAKAYIRQWAVDSSDERIVETRKDRDGPLEKFLRGRIFGPLIERTRDFADQPFYFYFSKNTHIFNSIAT
jgi:hypothetical protein